MRIGDRVFDTAHRTYVMGILNMTPDSFSDGGRFQGRDQALNHVEEMIAQGASIIDVGGESTRPGFAAVDDEEEIHRIYEIIREIKKRFDICVSADTYKSRVAEAAIEAGADMINDIWGLKADPGMASVIARSGVSCCLMHNRKNALYGDFVPEMIADLKASAALAVEAGISRDRIVLDPGVGFAKDHRQNILAIKNLGRIREELGYPALLGASRKSLIGAVLDLPVDQREEGTEVTTVWAVIQGCAFVRVHNVERNMRVIRMAGALLG